jgi:hypothetical protein
MLWSAVASAQFQKLVTDFENPGWPAFFTEVMFKNPGFSGSTVGIDTAGNVTYLTDITQDPFSVAHSGIKSSAITWAWTNPAYHTSWVRLVTINTAELPNPAVHLAGKVRFWASARAWTDGNFTTPVNTGQMYLGIGVRETGQGVGLGGDGGISGDIEWVGLNNKLTELFAGTNGVCNTSKDPNSDDLQLVPLNGAAGPDTVCIAPGPDNILQTAPSGDDITRTTPIGLYLVPTDGVMREYVFDLPALEAADKVFAFSGNGTLAATPNNRGTLEHLVFTNHPGNGAVNAKQFLVNVDDVRFEAPIIDPPAIVTDPNKPLPLDEILTVTNVDPNASQVRIYRLPNNAPPVQIGSVAPGGQQTLDVAVAPLPSNTRIVAQQTVGTNVSDDSTPVIVAPLGNGPLRIAMAVRESDPYDHALGCGADGTGYNPDAPSNLEFIGASAQEGFGVPTCPRFAPQNEWFEVVFNPCDDTYGVAPFSGNGILNLNAAPNWTVGVWEGLYFRIDELSPTTGPFTVYIDDLTVKDNLGNVLCLVDDFEGYAPGWYIVGDCTGNATADTVAAPGDIQVVSAGSPVFCGQIIVAPGPDGILQTVPAGDDGESPLHARFNLPGVAGTNVGIAATPNLTIVTDEEAHSGVQSTKIEWAYIDASNLQSTLRLTTNGSLATNPPQTLVNPDPVIRLSDDGTFCDGAGDIRYSVWIKLAPPAVPGDCDSDGDVDLHDMACFQDCFGSPASACPMFDIAPNHAPDGFITNADWQLLAYLFVGPQL